MHNGYRASFRLYLLQQHTTIISQTSRLALVPVILLPSFSIVNKMIALNFPSMVFAFSSSPPLSYLLQDHVNFQKNFPKSQHKFFMKWGIQEV